MKPANQLDEQLPAELGVVHSFDVADPAPMSRDLDPLLHNR